MPRGQRLAVQHFPTSQKTQEHTVCTPHMSTPRVERLPTGALLRQRRHSPFRAMRQCQHGRQVFRSVQHALHTHRQATGKRHHSCPCALHRTLTPISAFSRTAPLHTHDSFPLGRCLPGCALRQCQHGGQVDVQHALHLPPALRASKVGGGHVALGLGCGGRAIQIVCISGGEGDTRGPRAGNKVVCTTGGGTVSGPTTEKRAANGRYNHHPATYVQRHVCLPLHKPYWCRDLRAGTHPCPPQPTATCPLLPPTTTATPGTHPCPGAPARKGPPPHLTCRLRLSSFHVCHPTA